MSRPSTVNQKAKSGSSAVQLKTPRVSSAPAVYKPQPVPRVLQTKVKPGSAPPTYRPNPTPLVLQMKTGTHRTPHPPLMVPVIQRAEDNSGRSASNAYVYSSVGQHYTAKEIEEAQQEALGQNLHGHQTGGVGSGVSQQTKTEMEKVVEVLRKNRAKAKNKNKPIIEKAPMTGFQKARRKAEAIFAEKGKDGLGDFCQYLDTRAAELDLTEQEADQLVALFN